MLWSQERRQDCQTSVGQNRSARTGSTSYDHLVYQRYLFLHPTHPGSTTSAPALKITLPPYVWVVFCENADYVGFAPPAAKVPMNKPTIVNVFIARMMPNDPELGIGIDNAQSAVGKTMGKTKRKENTNEWYN